jgi:hypothetical protein
MGEIDTAVRGLIAHQASRAEAIVREHASALDANARAIVDRGHRMASEVIEIAGRHGMPLPQVVVRDELVEVDA